MLYYILFLIFIKCFMSSYYPNEYKKFEDKLKEQLDKIKEQVNKMVVILEPHVVNIGYNTIYCYSYIQIKLNHLLKFSMPYFNLLKTTVYNLCVQYQFIKPEIICENFTIVHKFTFENNTIEKDIMKIDKPYTELTVSNFNYSPGYNILVFYDCSIDNSMNIICKSSIPDNFSYELSNIKFMLVQLSYNDTVYALHLKTSELNYYIVDNVIDANYIKYYLTHVLEQKINEKFSYKLSIIDHNISMVEFNERHKLIIKKDDYTIVSCE